MFWFVGKHPAICAEPKAISADRSAAGDITTGPCGPLFAILKADWTSAAAPATIADADEDPAKVAV